MTTETSETVETKPARDPKVIVGEYLEHAKNLGDLIYQGMVLENRVGYLKGQMAKLQDEHATATKTEEKPEPKLAAVTPDAVLPKEVE